MNLLNGFIPLDLTMLIYPIRPDFGKLTDEEWEEIEGLVAKAVVEGILANRVIDYLQDRITRKELIATFPETNFDGSIL